jgi:hypothetical protein
MVLTLKQTQLLATPARGKRIVDFFLFLVRFPRCLGLQGDDGSIGFLTKNRSCGPVFPSEKAQKSLAHR